MHEVQQEELFHQHVVVMRHGDRIDNFEPMWDMKASRPWDPPLTQDGKDRAFARGRKFRTQFPIHRIFVSPFLRCLQTASEVIHGLCAVNDHDPAVTSSAGITIDPSKIKVFPPRLIFFLKEIYILLFLCTCVKYGSIRIFFIPLDT